MGRHHKPSVLPSSSSKVDFIRNPITIGLAEVKRFIWRPTKIFSLIQLTILVIFITCFLWTLWRLPPDHDYPDGACPASSYQILGEHNSIIGCLPCPECPSGQQLTPPCGSIRQLKIYLNTIITCTVCPVDPFKEGHGRGTCKPCQTCSPRETISPCTPTTNTQCGDCPRGYYQEGFTVDSCQKCSTCCAMKRFAELECIYLKQCIRTNCTQEIEIGENGAQKLDIILLGRSTPRRITPPRPMPLQSVPRSNSSENTRNLVSQDIVSHLKRTKVKREVQLAPQRANTLGLDYATKMAEEASSPLPDISNPATTATIVRFTNQRKAQEGFGTVSKDNTVRPTLQIASNYFGTNFKELLTALIALVAILILVLISIGALIACACWKTQSGHVQTSRCTVTCCAKNVYNEGYQPVLGNTTPQTDYDTQEVSHEGIDGDLEHTFSEEVKSLLLSTINPDLEDTLVKKLDVRHKGQYGWKKVGSAVGIDQLDLEYWETAYYYGMPTNSPTKELLETLKTRRPDLTVADLIDKL